MSNVHNPCIKSEYAWHRAGAEIQRRKECGGVARGRGIAGVAQGIAHSVERPTLPMTGVPMVPMPGCPIGRCPLPTPGGTPKIYL